MKTINALAGAMALAMGAAPAAATTSFITDPITNPSSAWEGIDYWGVQVTSRDHFDQLLSFDIPDYSKIDIVMQGSPKFRFTDILLNGVSILSDFSVGYSPALTATGYANAGAVSLQFVGDYTCSDCWSDWFGGYVQVKQAQAPTPSDPGAIPEPSSWAMMIGGFAIAGALIRRSTAQRRTVSFS